MTKHNIILIDKPSGWTSHDVCAKIKNCFNFKKVGHSGTLDPMATGLLVIGCNEQTKQLSKLSLDDKEYVSNFTFGSKTETGDKTGKVITSKPSSIIKKQLKQAIRFFKKGPYLQKPHIFSAKKVNGIRAYDLARAKTNIELKAVKVKINKIKILSFDQTKQVVILRMNVSKGFYVRSFCEDLAAKLGTFGYVSALRRTKCGKFKLKHAYKLNDYLKLNNSYAN